MARYTERETHHPKPVTNRTSSGVLQRDPHATHTVNPAITFRIAIHEHEIRIPCMKLSQRFGAFAAAAIAAIGLMTTAASADSYQQPTQNYCSPAEYKLVYAQTEYGHYSHMHLDVACPYDYRAIACGFDIGGDHDDGQNQHFVAINDASPYHFDSGHTDYKFEGEYGCHFRANNFAAYFPKYEPFYWNIKGTATCVPKDCVSVDETYDYYQDSRDAMLSWDWEQDYSPRY
jgi:hypothetical protein